MLRELGQHFDEIDVVGANTPHVAAFKRAYHGVLTPYYATERTRSCFLKAAMAVRAWWQGRRRPDGEGDNR